MRQIGKKSNKVCPVCKTMVKDREYCWICNEYVGNEQNQNIEAVILYKRPFNRYLLRHYIMVLLFPILFSMFATFELIHNTLFKKDKNEQVFILILLLFISLVHIVIMIFRDCSYMSLNSVINNAIVKVFLEYQNFNFIMGELFCFGLYILIAYVIKI